MRENKASQNGRHKRISPSLEELVDPELKAAVESKCGAENFVLAEDQEKNTDADAEQGQCIAVADAGIRSEFDRCSHSTAQSPAPTEFAQG